MDINAVESYLLALQDRRGRRDGGGGFDFTPYYPFEEDVVHWHRGSNEPMHPVSP